MALSNKIALVLHNIRSIHNVGSIFRTADATGVSKLFLTGYTPGPVDRFGREDKAFVKVSLGAEKLPWKKIESTEEVIEELKSDGYSVVALEQDKNAKDYNEFKPKFPLVLIVGNEVDGISKDILDNCDEIIEIPMRGKKESLNVAVATGVALFKLVSN